MTYFLVSLPDGDQLRDYVRDQIENVTSARVVELDRSAALAAGACDGCPAGCKSCPLDRASRECYGPDPPDPTVPTHPFFPASHHRIRCAAPAPLGAAGVCGQPEDAAVHRIEVPRD